MRALLFFTAVLISLSVSGQQNMMPPIGTTVHPAPPIGPVGAIEVTPTLPGTNIRDWSKPSYRVQGNTLYQTVPGTNSIDLTRTKRINAIVDEFRSGKHLRKFDEDFFSK